MGERYLFFMGQYVGKLVVMHDDGGFGVTNTYVSWKWDLGQSESALKGDDGVIGGVTDAYFS